MSLLATLICVASAPAIAGWSVLDSGTDQDLRSVDFPIDANTGYIVGSKGTVLKTTDAGASWNKQNSRTRSVLNDVQFVDNLIGYAVGADGTILKTADGGSRWEALDSGTTEYLRAVAFPVDSAVGYVGGASGTVLKTTDGGLTWAPQFGVEGSVTDIVFPQNNQTGYLSTIWGTLGYIYKTTDGGQNWTRVLWLEDAFLESMSFPVDDQVGYVANHDTYYQHGIWKTSDGGANWMFVTPGITAVPHAVDFPVDTQTGFAVGGAGAMLTTADGGANWTEGGIGVSATMNDVHFLDNTTGYAVGGSGVIAKTTDGGAPTVLSVYLHPTGAGSISGFTDRVGCTDDWDCVNDQDGNVGTGLPTTPISQDYVADASGNREMFALDDGVVPAGQAITEICVSIAATQSGGPYASLSYQRVGIDAEPVDTAPFWIGSYWYNGITSHCWDGLNWTPADLDALEIGVVSVDGQLIQAAQMYVKVYHRAAP